MHDPEDDEDYFDSEEDEDGWDEVACSLGPDGQCMQAGSEYCEFSCPFRNERE